MLTFLQEGLPDDFTIRHSSNFSLAGFSLTFRRNPLQFLTNYFLPSGMFVVVSWVTKPKFARQNLHQIVWCKLDRIQYLLINYLKNSDLTSSKEKVGLFFSAIRSHDFECFDPRVYCLFSKMVNSRGQSHKAISG